MVASSGDYVELQLYCLLRSNFLKASVVYLTNLVIIFIFRVAVESNRTILFPHYVCYIYYKERILDL